MLDVPEVVDSLAELPKICSYMKRTEIESPCSTLGKPDSPVWQTGLSGFVGSSDSQGTISSSEDVLLPVKLRLTKENKIHDNSRSCGGG
jgi:hypothetical protein